MKDLYSLPIKSLFVSKVYKIAHFYILPPIEIGINDTDDVIDDKLKYKFQLLYDNIRKNTTNNSLNDTSLLFFEYKPINYEKFNFSYIGSENSRYIIRTTPNTESDENLKIFNKNNDMFGSLDTEIIFNESCKQNLKPVFQELEKYSESLNYLLFFDYPYSQALPLPVIGINNFNQSIFFHLYNENEFYSSKIGACYSDTTSVDFSKFFKEKELLTKLIFNDERNEVEDLAYRALINYYSVLRSSDYNSAFMILLITFELLYSPEQYESFKHIRHFVTNIAFPNEPETTKNYYSELLQKSYKEIRTRIYHIGDDLFSYFNNNIEAIVSLINELMLILKNFIIESLDSNITSLQELYRKGE